MTLTLGVPTTAAPQQRHLIGGTAGFDCVHYAHILERRKPVLLAMQHRPDATDALSLLITRSCHIAEQLEVEPRRWNAARSPATSRWRFCVTFARARPVTVEIADPVTLYELTIHPRVGETA
ncbi:hypothetical protein ACFVZD_43450 [Streptomyces sp. NPDC058287]|uniref:hypothetical protein n=1 Tax=unclassified Streptomyces TaxID=2593676 RepID=UPI0036E07FFE